LKLFQIFSRDIHGFGRTRHGSLVVLNVASTQRRLVVFLLLFLLLSDDSEFRSKFMEQTSESSYGRRLDFTYRAKRENRTRRRVLRAISLSLSLSLLFASFAFSLALI
jgi:hypothetical protein